jgi:hypothetical protein
VNVSDDSKKNNNKKGKKGDGKNNNKDSKKDDGKDIINKLVRKYRRLTKKRKPIKRAVC